MTSAVSHGRDQLPVSAAVSNTAIEHRRAENKALITCETKLFHNYFSPRRRPPEIILFRRV